MNNSKAVGVIGLAVLAIAVLFYFFYYSPSSVANLPGQQVTSPEYVNTQYGFSVSLPKSWEGYTVVQSQWSGDSIDANGNVELGTVHGPTISIRHPNWSEAAPRQDIPVMVFTIQQWNDMQADKFHIGAAPVNPSELTRNAQYVFALPARYNFAYLLGYEEVDQIVRGGAVEAF